MKKKKTAATAPTHGASTDERPDVTPKVVPMAAGPVSDIHDQPANIVEFAIGSITVKPEFRGRVARSKSTVDEYADLMDNGTTFPPIVLFALDGEDVLVDGNHRLLAAKQIGKKTIMAELRHGTEEQALAYAVAANAKHGLPLTTKDKRRNAKLILAKHSDRSDRDVARLVGMSPTTIGSLRSALSNLDNSAGNVGKDGKIHGPKKLADNESGGNALEAFDTEAALIRVENHLYKEIERWPREARSKLGEVLSYFAKQLCPEDTPERIPG